MAITQAMCSSFKAEAMLAVHDFRPTGQSGASTFKLALYDVANSAAIDANTTSYTTTGEVTGTNYTAGGAALTNLGVTTVNSSSTAGTGYTNFSNLTFANVTVTAGGALIYNSTPKANSNANTTLTNTAVCVLNFGSEISATNGNFTIIFPTASNTTASIRIS